jgi:anaerobic ribonucleoside-triphosphate reductase
MGDKKWERKYKQGKSLSSFERELKNITLLSLIVLTLNMFKIKINIPHLEYQEKLKIRKLWRSYDHISNFLFN